MRLRFLVGGIDNKYGVRVHPDISTLTVILQPFHPNGVGAIIERQSIITTCVIPT
ncbi:MAG: hypothetical protein J6P54_05830 [Bacteroidales bacterium]|nr:hypothetical protein [Bacteroidales bacterium]